ncbi:unnamed protein product [Oikopleura dioica]|uniref:Homeobox domain-containing protein n=1 Tax=Oikopleura dioica TaxID=34765 RepID=E4XQ46_OIKDI|nr:unnamed protein product [Oikopleura dioica]
MNSPDVMFRNGFPLAYQYTSAQVPYHQTGTTGYYMWSGAEPTVSTAQTLNETGDSVGNSSTMSSGSPPPQEALVEHQVLHPHNAHTGHAPIKVEDAYGGTAYPAMQNHHFHYQQQIQALPGITSLSWAGSEQEEWRLRHQIQHIHDPNKTRTREKYRVVYTNFQRLELEKEYRFNRYITISKKAELAKQLQLSERQIKIWFQNRRAKERKQTKRVGSESENGGDDADSGAVGEDILVGSSPASEQNMTEGEQEIAALQSSSSSSGSPPGQSPAIQSIMDNLVDCTEKYLSKTEWIKFEPK